MNDVLHQRRASIVGLGIAVPEHSATQAQTMVLAKAISNPVAAVVLNETECDPPRRAKRPGALIEALYQRSGINQRGSVLLSATDAASPDPVQTFFGAGRSPPGTGERMLAYAEHAPALAARASRMAMEEAACSGASVTHLITVSCTGFAAPGVDIELFDRLGLRSDVARTHVGFMGCHGAINALRIADAIATSVTDAVVLVVCVELCSLHLQHTDRADQHVANALFADGAAACIVTSEHRGHPITLTASKLMPDSRDCMSWSVTDHGFAMTLSQSVPDVIREHLAGWLSPIIERVGGAVRWAVHPGGPRILDAVRDSMRLDESAVAASRDVLRQHGNMSSATVLFILARLIANGDSADGMATVLLAFGPGLAAELAIIGPKTVADRTQ
jgi:predicted naringenin-chalcone synthase